MTDFRFEHTKLSVSNVLTISKNKNDFLDGFEKPWEKIVNCTLNLFFADKYSMVLSFDSQAKLSATRETAVYQNIPFKAIRSNSLVILAFSLENEKTILLIYEIESGKAVLFITWLCEAAVKSARESQRVYYLGNVYDSSAATAVTTKRLVGKVIEWTGADRCLTVYASPIYSSFVPEGSVHTFVAPTDYFELDDRYFVYSRVECEFSGELVVEAIDLYSMEKLGIRCGINDNDRYELAAYRAKGILLGNLAAYRAFGKKGEEIKTFGPPNMPVYEGCRPVYRPFEMTLPMSLSEVAALAERTGSWTGAFSGVGKEKHVLPFTDKLAGRRFTLRFDETGSMPKRYDNKHRSGCNSSSEDSDTASAAAGHISYVIKDGSHMEFDYSYARGQTQEYRAFEADDELYFFTHAENSLRPTVIYQYVLDFKTGLATMLRSSLDNPDQPREPKREWAFGIIEADGIETVSWRHSFTDELVGNSYTWEYTDDIASQHIYTTSESYSWSILADQSEPSLMWSSPCKYVKIRDDVYLMSWVEERSAGTQGTLLFNKRTMHDCGACFGITHGQVFEYNTFGAHARSAGNFNRRI